MDKSSRSLSPVASLLRQVRESKGCSARALSVSAGLSQAYVSKVETGDIEPSLYGFSKIAIALQLNHHEIYSIVLVESARQRHQEQQEKEQS